jgi:hypothetical protein
VRYARWSNSPCAAASCDSTSPRKGSTPRGGRWRRATAHWAATDGRVCSQDRSMRGFSWCVRRATDRSPVRAPPFFAAGSRSTKSRCACRS